MLSKYLSSTLLLFALSIHVDAHAAIFPALGVLGTPVRGDVQVPSKPSPCGNINVAANINNSTAVQADPNGQFKVNVIDFNPYFRISENLLPTLIIPLHSGKDGSRHVSLTVDPTGLGIGTSFVNGTVSKNGNPVRVIEVVFFKTKHLSIHFFRILLLWIPSKLPHRYPTG